MRYMKQFICVAAMLVAGSAFASGRFSASEAPGFGIKQSGRVVVRNNDRFITAYQFFGNVRQALMTLKTSRVLRFTPFGSNVYNTNATAAGAAPAYLSALFTEAGKAHGVDPRLIAAVARRESAFNPRARSAVGAGGLMQLMPATANFLGVNDVYDARQNVFGGARYLRTLLDTFHGDLDLTLAAYNAGPGAVQRYNGVPPYRETRQYVQVVRASYESALAR
jgi:soluble lytic murein transglycosylase-like protein